MANPADIPPVSPIATVTADISPDGIPLQQSAAPVKAAPESSREPVKSIKDLEKVDEGVKTVDTKAEADEPEININDFLDVAGKDLKPETQDKPVKEKVDEQPLVAETTKQKQSREELVKKDKSTRDLSDIEDAELQALLKEDVSRKAFDKILPIIKESKKLKADTIAKEAELKKVSEDYKKLREEGPQLPESYYEHDEGYLLNPEFRNAARELTLSQQILGHWQKQLENVSEGAPEFDYLDFNQQTGQLEITGKIKADRASEGKLMTFISHAQNLVTNKQANVQTVMSMHKEKYSNTTKQLDTFVNSAFEAFQKPENKPIYEPLIKQKLEQFGQFKNNPLLKVVAHSLVLNEVLGKLLKQAAEDKSKLTTKEPDKETNRLRQPSADEIAGGGAMSKANGKNDNISLDDFEAVKNGL